MWYEYQTDTIFTSTVVHSGISKQSIQDLDDLSADRDLDGDLESDLSIHPEHFLPHPFTSASVLTAAGSLLYTSQMSTSSLHSASSCNPSRPCLSPLNASSTSTRLVLSFPYHMYPLTKHAFHTGILRFNSEFRTGVFIFRFWSKDFRIKRRFSFPVLQVNSSLPFTTILDVSSTNSEFFFHLRARKWRTPLNFNIWKMKLQSETLIYRSTFPTFNLDTLTGPPTYSWRVT